MLIGNPLLPFLLPQAGKWNEALNFTLKAVNAATGKAAHLARDGELNPAALEAQGDMLSRMAATMATTPEKLSTRNIVVVLSANVFAGSDTTATALRAIIYFLLKHPEKMAKLVREIDDADKTGMFSDLITYKESTANLPYLDAVVKESVRLFPSIGLLLERHVPAQGPKICRVEFAAGTIVGCNAWVTQRDPDVFPDPDTFNPERWLEAGEAQLRKMDRAFFAFGGGTRTCLGKHISLMEMTKVVPQLLREFELSFDEGPEQEWMMRNVWVGQQKGLNLRLKRRNHVSVKV